MLKTFLLSSNTIQLNEKNVLAKDFKELINSLVEQRLKMNDDGNANPKDKYKLTMEISMLRNEYQKIINNNSITLANYVVVMEDIFNAIQKRHPKIFMQLLDFQEEYLNEIALKLT